MRNFKLGASIAIGLSAGMFIPMVLSVWLTLVNQRAVLSHELTTYHNSVAQILSTSMADPIWNMVPDSGKPILNAIMKDERLLKVIVNAEKGVFLEQKNNYDTTVKSKILVKPVLFHNRKIGEVIVEIDTGQMENALYLQKRTYLIITALQFFFSIFIIFLLLQFKVIKPVHTLIKQSEKLAQKDLDDEFVWKQSDEIGLLGKSFEQTRKSLLNLFNELELMNQQAKEHALEMKNAKDEAESASKAKSDFLANISHEIRTPMNALFGLIDLMQKTEMNKEQQNYILMMQSSTRNLMGVINDILDFSKIEAGQMYLEEKPFDLRDVVDTVISPLTVYAYEKGIELLNFCSESVPVFLMGDSPRLRQILMNLMGNGVKFTQSGEVGLFIEVEDKREDEVWLRFIIRDTGIGIQEDKKVMIFESFTQADTSTVRAYGGSGLGLAISKKLVALMGGSIWFESPVTKYEFQDNKDQASEQPGTVFYFTACFRLDQKENEILSFPDNIENMPVLIIDDNKSNRIILRKIMESWKFSVHEVSDGKQGIEEINKAKEQNMAYKLMLTDYDMPYPGGFDLVKQLKEIPDVSDIPIILMASPAENAVFNQCREDKLCYTIAKPVKREDLYKCIAVALQYKAETVQDYEIKEHKLVSKNAGQLKMLLVEDNPVSLEVGMAILEYRDYLVTPVTNGLEALKALTKERFDGILMDVQMPVMDGNTATKMIRLCEKGSIDNITEHNDILQKLKEHIQGTRIPIIAMTAHALESDRERCFKSGMDEYLTKPCKPQELFSILDRIFQNENIKA